MSRSRFAFMVVLFFAFSILLGLLVASKNPIIWDDLSLYRHSQWVTAQYKLIDHAPYPGDTGTWNAALPPLFFGIFTEVIFPWLRDPYAVRHALLFAMLPLTLLGTWFLLRRAGLRKASASLIVCLLLADIRFGGHALTSPDDFPGAAGFLLVTLWLWILLREGYGSSLKTIYSTRSLLSMGAVAALPFVLQSPLLFHFVLVLCFCIYLAVVTPGLKAGHRLWICVAPLLSGLLTIFVFSPGLWEHGVGAWAAPLALFSKFPWQGEVRVFGQTFLPETLPWWYPYAWIPIRFHPLALLILVCGWIGLVWERRKLEALILPLRTWRGAMVFTLPIWLLLIIFVTWFTVFLVHPNLSEEDRHILFLYPPLVILAGIGLSWLSARWSYALCTLLLVCSLWSYWRWGPFSYVYKSPLIGDTHSERFMGDYRGVCLGYAVDQMIQFVSPSMPVVLQRGPVQEAQAQQGRLRYSRLFGDSKRPGYKVISTIPKRRPYALLAFNRMEWDKRAVEDSRRGRSTLLWSMTMLPEDRACTLSLYDR